MSKVLLAAAGVVNGLFALFHLYLGYRIQFFPVPVWMRGILETFNAGGLLIMVLMAFIFLARGREVVRTGIGAAFLIFGAALYLGRAVEEFIWMRGSVTIAAICVAAGLLHLAILPFVKVPAQAA